MRSQAIAVAAVLNYGSNFLVSLALPTVEASVGLPATYLGFAAIGAVALLSIYYTGAPPGACGAPSPPASSGAATAAMRPSGRVPVVSWLRMACGPCGARLGVVAAVAATSVSWPAWRRGHSMGRWDGSNRAVATRLPLCSSPTRLAPMAGFTPPPSSA